VRRNRAIVTAILFLLAAAGAAAQNRQGFVLERSNQLEVVWENERYVTYVDGEVKFRTETGAVYCDSATFVRGEYAKLRGRVLIDDQAYMLRADSVYYDLTRETALALGSQVQLWSYADSLYAAGVHAFYDRPAQHFEMQERPTVYLGYPDTAAMVEVVANTVNYFAPARRAEAVGRVVITSQDIAAAAECAVMLMDRNTLDLYDGPTAKRGRSTMTGGFMSIAFGEDQLREIDVIDSARGEFIEPIDSAETDVDRSILAGSRIKMFFDEGDLRQVLASGQAYSWYYPSPRGTREFHENTVSGDTIRLFVREERLEKVAVVGGAAGTYITGTVSDSSAAGADTAAAPETAVSAAVRDSTAAATAATRLDTVDYRAEHIVYSLVDSLITLDVRSEVKSGAMELRAYDVDFDTRRRVVEAFSAEITPDAADRDYYSLAERLQPAAIPVILKDGADELHGDYLEYSIDTEKGRIVQTKSEFEQGYYYGGKLFRQKRDVYYIEDGYYTTCGADEPHFHFYSSRMKLMQDNKLIARPVVFYLGRIPLMAIPYYVFPLKKGRHSGFLPFTFGRFERGERYVNNLGYYWAASEYWDYRGAVDYHDLSRTITFKSEVQFRKRYLLDGYLRGEYRRQTQYNRRVALENSPTSYSFSGAYNHTLSPSFDVRSSGSYVSTASYYTDYSNSLAERLNRNLVSQVNFSKKFGRLTSVTGSVQHTENLDLEQRTDQLPSLSVSLPPIYPFGGSSTNDEGETVTRWYNQFILRYNPTLLNYSTRSTILADTIHTLVDTLIDTTFVDDTTIVAIDTTYRAVEIDSLMSRSRRHYLKVQHNPSITLPTIRIIPYVPIVPSFSYSETWFKIFETDQSQAAGIDASEFYRTYSYSAGVSANTKLYGTVYPGLFGLLGLRHVLEPSVGYRWSPDIQRYPEVRSFAGGGAASSKSQSIGFGLGHLFQAKVRTGETEKNIDLLSVRSSFAYDLERDFRPLSQMTTSFQTSTIPRLNISGDMRHTFYNPYDDSATTPKLLSPWLLDFDLNLSFDVMGRTFLFTDEAEPGVPLGVDSASALAGPELPMPSAARAGWNLAVTYSFSESGRHRSYSKSSFVNITLGFGLTPSTSVNYNQRYDLVEGRTISSQVNIVRSLHCWTGSLFWVPVGSNTGFGFKLWVNELPDIKLDSNHDSFISTDVLRR